MCMRIILFSVLISGQFVSLSAQDIAPDSVYAAYVPLDSLNEGLDIALSALKMHRGDLTFRGDYLEPDAYRLRFVDDYMKSPLKLIDFAGRDFEFRDICILIDCEPDIFGSRFYLISDKMNPLFTETDDIMISNNLKEAVQKDIYVLIRSLFNFAYVSDFRNSVVLNWYSEPEIDSLINGFTILLEENVGDEFLSANELDSLEQYTDLWAEKLAVLSRSCIGRTYLVSNFLFFFSELIENYSVPIPFESKSVLLESPLGQIIIGDTTDNHYTGDLFMVIDPGGDDTYDIRLDGTGHHTYIIDYGGDDTYNMPKNKISPYFFGSNMIIDYEGDDSYNAGSWTLGAGLFGVGVLWDMKGNDRYFGDTFTQGAGCFGVGILRDDEGNDSYQAALFSQGFGFVEGIGILIDSSGNDNYFAGGKYKDFIRYNDHYLSLSQGFAYGIRPRMSGGVGMLIDKSGNDVYVSDIFGQGASYWYGLGMLADGGGNDQYISFQYAQGNGTHMSLGILYDVSGDDVYSAKGVSQGCGHDRAAGMLIDLDGDDNYNTHDLCQGAGSANGLGIIADVRGKDVYIVRSDKNTQGYGNPRREYGSIGIFLDLGGKDGYSGGMGRDNHWWTYSKWGVGIDK